MARRKVRPIRVDGNVAYIALTRGYETVIDAEDLPHVADFNWSSQPSGKTVYACRGTRSSDGKSLGVRMHRVLIGAPDGMEVDHIDGDGLNNRKANLRLATHAENCMNRRVPVTNSSGLKGVSWHKGQRQWVAKIKVSGITVHIGSFNCPEQAHRAYCEAAARIHGKFARSA